MRAGRVRTVFLGKSQLCQDEGLWSGGAAVDENSVTKAVWGCRVPWAWPATTLRTERCGKQEGWLSPVVTV